jgi:hypothetical protein
MSSSSKPTDLSWAKAVSSIIVNPPPTKVGGLLKLDMCSLLLTPPTLVGGRITTNYRALAQLFSLCLSL